MDLRKYLALFVTEAGEHLAGLAAELVRLEQCARAGEPVGGLVDETFRRAHSVKGMAAAMEQDGIAAVAHGAEDLLGLVRGKDAAPGPEVIDLLLAACDAMQGMVARAGEGEAPAADGELLGRMEAALAAAVGAPAATPTPTPVPASTAPPIPASTPDLDPRARRRVSVEVRVSDACPVPAVRGFLVLKKLAGLGGVVEAAPSLEDLRGGRIPDRVLRVLLETAEPREAILRTLSQIADLGEPVVRDEEPPAPPRPQPPPAPDRADPGRTLRVRTDLLDHCLDLVGELLLAAARIREVARTLPDEHRPRLDDEVDRLHGSVKDLHDRFMAVRMTPVALVTDPLPRAARDLARRTGKQVEVEVNGQSIEMDRALLDDLADPLLHLIRNAVDHGIEAPHLRQLAGKPPVGRITISARRERDRAVVEVQDDGRGMDPEKLRAAAIARGALDPAAAAGLGPRDCLLLACLPGVSTAVAVTDVSGRGVGMDAVKRTVEDVGGTLEIDSAPGAGTRIVLRLPLTVAVQPVLLVRVGAEVLGLPIAKVHGAAQVDVAALDRSHGAPVLPHDGRLVPVRELSDLLGFGEPGRGPRAVVVADGEGAPVGLAVDALLGQQEAVLKPVAGPLERVAGLSAVTVLGNGRPVFILDVQRLLAA
jgi:two-component system chemotaxis sensor kinase CheA